MIDDRLAAVPKGIPDYYDAYQRGIEDYSIECAVAKVFCSDVLAQVVDEVVQIFGGYGYTQEYPAERFYRDERINRIFEGTNEINRMLIPGTLLRRAMKGEIPLQDEVMKAVGRLSAAAGEAPSGPFGAEKALLRNLKDAFLVLAGAAVQRFGPKVKDEQEALIALADVAIGVFAIESAVLRAEKIAASGNASRTELAAAAVRAFAFPASEAAISAARRAAFYVGEGNTLQMLLTGIRRATRYDATGLLDAKHKLAAAALEKERYPL
jgi:butyryl-CoA dehydrogenase